MTKTGRVQKLTKRVVDATMPTTRRFIVWDTELPGFGLRVEPTGRKTFVARYRAGGGRTGVLRQATVGRYGAVSLDEGRANAKKLLGAAASGKDPVGDRKSTRQAGLTIAEICDWYVREAEAGRILGRKGRPIKRSTLITDRSRIENHVKPLLGKRAVKSISLHDIEAMQADIAAHTTAHPHREKGHGGARVSGGSGAGGRTLSMLRAILEHATRSQLIAFNPARGARKMANYPRKFRLSIDQIRTLGTVMQEAAAENENPTGLAAIRLLLLSGLRRGEALGLRPEWLMPTGGVDFPDTKAGPQVRPLGYAAMDALRTQIASVGSCAWVFPADRGDGHFVTLPKVLARVCKRAGLEGVTPHSLRHTFASVAAELGFSELTIAGLLGHSAGSVTAGYVHLDSALVTAADRVSAVIADTLDGKTAAKVIQLREEAS